MASSGSGGGAELPPPPICCMCGDQGLLQEMFRCKLCAVRSQHKYCSELYLKTESYRACNWCLREYSGGGGSNNEGSAKLNNNLIPLRDAKKSSSSTSSSSNNPAIAAASTAAGAVKIHREAFPSQLNDKPVKRLRVLQPPPLPPPASASDVSDRLRAEQELHKGRQQQPQQVGKAKVRRYKLLEEVSS